MSNVLFLGVPSHGHINPTVGLVHELVARGETVTYFASPVERSDRTRNGAEFTTKLVRSLRTPMG